MSPKFGLDDSASKFVVPRSVRLRVALYFVAFLGHSDERAVNIMTLHEMKEREEISFTVRIFCFLRNFQTGSENHPDSRLTQTGTSFSGSKSTGGLKQTAQIHAIRGNE